MSTLAKPAPSRHEPAETDDPRNALLDAAEDLIRRALALDLGPQLRTRIERLLPAPAFVAPGDSRSPSRPPGAEGARENAREHLVRMSIVHQALSLKAGAVRSEPNRKIVENAHRVIAEEISADIETIKGPGAAASQEDARS